MWICGKGKGHLCCAGHLASTLCEDPSFEDSPDTLIHTRHPSSKALPSLLCLSLSTLFTLIDRYEWPSCKFYDGVICLLPPETRKLLCDKYKLTWSGALERSVFHLRLCLFICTMSVASPITKDDLGGLHEAHASAVGKGRVGEICRTGWWLGSKRDEVIGLIEASTG